MNIFRHRSKTEKKREKASGTDRIDHSSIFGGETYRRLNVIVIYDNQILINDKDTLVVLLYKLITQLYSITVKAITVMATEFIVAML